MYGCVTYTYILSTFKFLKFIQVTKYSIRIEGIKHIRIIFKAALDDLVFIYLPVHPTHLFPVHQLLQYKHKQGRKIFPVFAVIQFKFVEMVNS